MLKFNTYIDSNNIEYNILTKFQRTTSYNAISSTDLLDQVCKHFMLNTLSSLIYDDVDKWFDIYLNNNLKNPLSYSYQILPVPCYTVIKLDKTISYTGGAVEIKVGLMSVGSSSSGSGHDQLAYTIISCLSAYTGKYKFSAEITLNDSTQILINIHSSNNYPALFNYKSLYIQESGVRIKCVVPYEDDTILRYGMSPKFPDTIYLPKIMSNQLSQEVNSNRVFSL